MSTVAFIRRCMAVGMDLETALLAAEQFESAPDELNPRQARNARYYQNKRLKASETSESKTLKTVSDDPKTVKTLSDAVPSCARVRELSPRLVISGSVGVVVGAEREQVRQTDDWPAGNGPHLAKLLVDAAGSPWLDPAKSPDLITTMGRLAAWKRDGASWEHDVLPVVAGLCANRRSRISSWKFFDQAVARSIAENRAALEIPEAANPPRGQGPPGGSFADQRAAEIAEAQRIAFARLDARNG